MRSGGKTACARPSPSQLYGIGTSDLLTQKKSALHIYSTVRLRVCKQSVFRIFT